MANTWFKNYLVNRTQYVCINGVYTKYIVFRNKNMHFDPNSCNISIENEILERIGNDWVNKYFKFVRLKLDEFLNWDFQIENT